MNGGGGCTLACQTYTLACKSNESEVLALTLYRTTTGTSTVKTMFVLAPKYCALVLGLSLSVLMMMHEPSRVGTLFQCQSCRRSQMPFFTLVVVATSAAPWIDRRDRIRTQFPRNVQLIRNDKQSVVLKFALGTQGQSDDILASAHSEADRHRDILLLPCLDLDDNLNDIASWHLAAGPSATTSKVMLSIQWAVQNYRFDYFFRLGDDSYFRVDQFMAMLNAQVFPDQHAVIGRIESGYVFDMQQAYPQGAGYALTYDVCTFIAINTAYLMDTAPEDCVVARWLFSVGASFVHSPLWRDMGLGERCENDMVLAHKLPVEYWASINANGTVTC